MTEIITDKFVFSRSALHDVWVVDRRPIFDHRGFFSRFYCRDSFARIGVEKPVDQMNHSFSAQAGSIRGLHYQHAPHGETKVVTCVAGRIWDVVVDIRRDSPDYLRWTAVELSAGNRRSLVVPPGFAHGFQTLELDAEVLYLVDTPYRADAEDGLNPCDPSIGITWPLPISEMSARDRVRTFLST